MRVRCFDLPKGGIYKVLSILTYSIYWLAALIVLFNIIKKRRFKYIFIPIGTICIMTISLMLKEAQCMHFCLILYQYNTYQMWKKLTRKNEIKTE